LGTTAGYKFNHWELKGVPIRIEIGPKDIQKEQVILVRRDTGEKKAIKSEKLLEEIENTLNSIQKNLYEKAKKLLEENIVEVDSYEDLKVLLLYRV
jgi:prolyl-tRNA synthetase